MSASASSVTAAASASRRPPGSQVRHGQPSCSDYGCTLPECRQAAARARRQRNSDRAAGLSARVASAPAAEYAALLRWYGMCAQDIADASGISVTLIRRLLRMSAARPSQISRTSAEAILGIVACPRNTRHDRGGMGLTDAAHAADILMTLARAGWPARYLSARLGVSTQTLAALRNRQRPRLSISLEQRIRKIYPQLAATMPEAAGIRAGDTARARAYHNRRRTEVS